MKERPGMQREFSRRSFMQGAVVAVALKPMEDEWKLRKILSCS